MPDLFLAVDLGAESGRAVLGSFKDGLLSTSEVRRFANEPVEYGDSLHWDVARLWLEIRRSLKDLGPAKLNSIGVDAWGVDYGLLGERGELLGNPYHYRDRRTAGIMDEVFLCVPPARIYHTTGIQFMPINTLFQLYAASRRTPRLLACAERLLTIPDLFHFWLTGNAVCESTNASTTQMVDASAKTWATVLMQELSVPTHFLPPIVEPGNIVGHLSAGLGTEHSGLPVIAPACHDTGSAFAAIGLDEETAFLSSGTWSLLGVEIGAPIINVEARRANFTNEGGVCGTTRFLKNVMGMWILQRCRKSFVDRGEEWTYDRLIEAAASTPAFRSLINPDDERFLSPPCMVAAIEKFCDETEQQRPQSPGTFARVVMESLALRYAMVLRDLERLTGRTIRRIRVVGGGCCNDLMNQFTADATGCKVVAGPVEATAIGNIVMQMVGSGAVMSLSDARECVERSWSTRTFEPRDTDAWEQQKTRFEELLCLKQ